MWVYVYVYVFFLFLVYVDMLVLVVLMYNIIKAFFMISFSITFFFS